MDMFKHVMYQSANLNRVAVGDAYYANALEKEVAYLKSLDKDRLLAGFREVKGLEKKAEVYPGWESCEIKGHTLGHYLTAISQAYACTGDESLRRDIEYVIDELAEAQLESGYLFASGEYLFDNVENNKPAWVPWYTMHKIIEGIIMAYETTGYRKAYDVMYRLADWVHARTSRWDEKLNLQVLKVEYGGMNDCLYDVYSHTGKPEHLQAAGKFDETALFKAFYEGRDILNGLHANTTIPKFVGAVKRYMVLDDCDEFYLKAGENFWDTVVNHHTYITGGNSEWEHFGPPDVLDARRTNCNCETCNTYNMLKLSKELFMVTGRKKYLDFYDNTLTNAILSSQNPKTGMTMYFQPMASGYFKVYSTPYDKFWCCTGTGIENFTKLNDGIYYYRNDADIPEVIVGRYVSSALDIEEIPVKLKTDADYPGNEESRITVLETGDSSRFVLKLRIPDWCRGYEVDVNGESDGISESDGFICIDRIWKRNDAVNITFRMSVTYESLADNRNTVGFKYGPVVLSAGLGTDNMEVSRTGVDVTIPTRNMEIKDYILIKDMTVDEWLAGIGSHLVKRPGTLEFVLRNTDEDDRLVFTPHYKRHDERYGIYFTLFDKDSDSYKEFLKKKEEKRRLEMMTVDLLPVGNDQYELQHEVRGEKTFSDTWNGYNCRGAFPEGYFEYKMKVAEGRVNELIMLLAREGHPVDYEIQVDEKTLLSSATIEGWPPMVYEEKILIPAKMTEGRDYVAVKFINRSDKAPLKLYGQLRMISE